MKIEAPLCFLQTFVSEGSGAYWETTWWRKGTDKMRVWSQSPHLYAEWFYLSRSNHYNLHFTIEQSTSCRQQMRSSILKWLVLFLGCYSNLNIISSVLSPTLLVMNRNCKFSLQRGDRKGLVLFLQIPFYYIYFKRSLIKKKKFSKGK